MRRVPTLFSMDEAEIMLLGAFSICCGGVILLSRLSLFKNLEAPDRVGRRIGGVTQTPGVPIKTDGYWVAKIGAVGKSQVSSPSACTLMHGFPDGVKKQWDSVHAGEVCWD